MIKTISNPSNDKEEIHWMCELVLVMNGENDKAWNIKKSLLLDGKLDLERELKFNAAVCTKNKKSSSYYDYRIRIYQSIMKNSSKKDLLTYYELETKMIAKILTRFLRNYYCWMYRNKLFKLLLPSVGN